MTEYRFSVDDGQPARRPWAPLPRWLTRMARREGGWLIVASAPVAAMAWAVVRFGWWTAVAAASVLWAATWIPAVRRAIVWRRPRRGGGVSDPVLPRRTVEAVSGRAKVTGVAARLRRDWDTVCAEAKWVRGSKDDPQTPTLVYARRDGDTLAVGFRPWINEGETKWDGHAHVIRRAVKGQTVRWWVNAEDSGLLELRVGLTPLPRKIVLEEPPAPVATDGSARFIVGPIAGGGAAYWVPMENSHCLITGTTNMGKGGTIRMILAQAARWRVRVWNPKQSGEFRWCLRFHDARVVNNPRDAIAMLQEIEEDRIRVQAIVEKLGLDNWTELPPDIRPTPTLLVVDEASVALDDEDPDAQAAGKLLAELARQGRSAGLAILVATQRPDVASGALGPRGGALRAQLSTRMVVGGIDKQGLDMTLPGVSPDVIGSLGGIRGRVLARGLDGMGDVSVGVVQVGWLDRQVAERAAGAPLPARESDMSVSDVSGLHPPYVVGGVPDRTSDVSDMSETGRCGGDAPPAGDADAGPTTRVDCVAEASPIPEDTAGEGAADGPEDVTTAPSGDAPDGWVEMRLVDAADHLGVSERQVRRRLKSGDPGIQYVRRGVVAVASETHAGTAA